MPSTAAPIPVFDASEQNVFAYLDHYAPAPAVMFPKEPPKKRKYKTHET
jgi:hypothetical protein